MNSFGHLTVSIAKSALRIGACIWCICTGAVLPLAIGFLAAEVLGIVVKGNRHENQNRLC